MRNLKKILALVLALVMSLSLMATAGAKDFGDSDQVNANYKTAIDVLSELKVFGGYDDGTFKPQQNITRAEVAAIIYRIATGDVMGDKVALYSDMTNSKLADLNQAEWARGQINYCYNAGIIKGVNNTDFEPNANITGYAALSMILRALGYGQNGEFVGTQWEMNTAARARELGLLDKITEGQLGLPATREMVAEILFRAMLKETVTWTALNGYQTTGTTLAKSILGLDDVVGVVVANEWASLIGNKPLAEGKTTLKIDGKNRTVNVSTEGADLGTSVHVYLKGEDVLTDVEDAGNDILTNEGAKTTTKDLLGGMDTDADTQYFVNYGESLRDDSDWRLEYVVVEKMSQKEAAQLVLDNGGVAFIDSDPADLVYNSKDADEYASLIDNNSKGKDNASTLAVSGSTAKETYTYNKSIPAGQKLTSTDLGYMETIFKNSDSFNDDAYQGHDVMNGEVYAATKSGKYDTDKSYDVSDDLSWNQFCEKYLNLDANAGIDGAANGESLRIIDNNGDGVAEYVLKVEFVMTTVVDYDKRTDTYYVEYDKDGDPNPNKVDTAIKASAIKGEENLDLSTDAVVLYALVDGVYYTSNPEVVTATVDKKGIDTKNDTVTADGEEHVWSGIFREAVHYYDEPKELAEQTKYDFHLDRFGYVRLANEANKGFVLLTDGYYWSNRREETRKVELYDDASSELIEAEVVDYKESSIPQGFFIDTEYNHEKENYVNIDDSWRRLNAFGTTYQTPDDGTDGKEYIHYSWFDRTNGNTVISADPFNTNIAAYTEEDGKYSLFSVEDTSILRRDRLYHTYEIAGTKQGTATTAAQAGITLKQGSVSAKDANLYGIEKWKNETVVSEVQRIMTTSTTQYYLVNWDSKGRAEVESWVGYNNVPEDLGDFVAKKAYAVTYKSDSTEDYDVAEVVVFEGNYEDPIYNAWLTYAARSETYREYSLGIDPDGENGYGDWLTDLGVFKNLQVKSAVGTFDGNYTNRLLRFYTRVNGNPVDVADTSLAYSDYGIYVGTINTRRNVNYRDYITFGNGLAVYELMTAEDMAQYRFVFDSRYTDSEIDAVDADEQTRLLDGDKVIYMLNADGEVAMVVNLSDSVDEKGNKIPLSQIPALDDLYDEIEASNEAKGFWTLTVNGGKALDANGDEITRIAKSADYVEITLKDASDANVSAVNSISGAEIKKMDTAGKWLLTDIDGNVTINVTAPVDTFKGELVSIDPTNVILSGTGYTRTIKINDASQLMVGSLESKLAGTRGSSIYSFAAYDVDGNVIPAASPSSLIKTIKITLVSRDGDLSSEYTLTAANWTPITTYNVTLKDYADGKYKAYWTYSKPENNNPVPESQITYDGNGDATVAVENGKQIMLVAVDNEVGGSWTATNAVAIQQGGPGVPENAPGYSPYFSVCSIRFSINNSAVTVTFTPYEEPEPVAPDASDYYVHYQAGSTSGNVNLMVKRISDAHWLNVFELQALVKEFELSAADFSIEYTNAVETEGVTKTGTGITYQTVPEAWTTGDTPLFPVGTGLIKVAFGENAIPSGATWDGPGDGSAGGGTLGSFTVEIEGFEPHHYEGTINIK